MDKVKKPKKKFSETGVGKFLKEKGSSILGIVGEVLPEQGWMGIVKNLVSIDTKLSEEERNTAHMLIEIDVAEMKAITSRWTADMKSDNQLSKNIRPMILIALTAVFIISLIADSLFEGFHVEEAWIDLLRVLLISVYLAYFGSRGYEKAQTIIGEYKQKL
jgi:hypothetical protein